MSEVQPPNPTSPAAVTDPLADVGCKSRLQQYTQKAAMPLPMYQTVNEGRQHAPHFRSRVWVDGSFYTSPMTFTTRKAAEQSSARYALIGLLEKVKNEARARIKEDSIFCKAIVNEYASKLNIEAPTYVTNESKAVVPIFISSVTLNDVTHVGDAGKNKKEAEQLAARAAILSILESETGTTTMSQIMKSKSKLYEELNKARDLAIDQGQSVDSGAVQISPIEKVPVEDPNPTASIKRKEVETCGAIVSAPAQIPKSGSGQCPIHHVSSGPSITQPAVQISPAEKVPVKDPNPTASVKRKEVETCGGMVAARAQIPKSGSGLCPIQHVSSGPSITQPADQPHHEFKKHKSQTSEEKITLISFVPPSAPPAPMCPAASAPAKKRKNKRNKKKQQQASLADSSFPPTHVPVCSA